MQQPRLQLLPSPTGPTLGSVRRVARFAAIELGIWVALYGVYLAVRGVAIGSPDVAVAHASDVVGAERAVGAFHEAQLQQALLPVADFFSAYYMLCFGPLIATVVVWLGLRRPDLYRQLRNALLLSIGLATIVFVLFPCAPPRLLPGIQIQDTVGLSGHDTGSFMGIRFNPYAAVPSMHVGWSAIVAWFGFGAARRRLVQAFFCVHPVLMAVTVTGTGNHYFFDSVSGLAVAALSMALLSRFRRRRAPFRLVPPADEPVLSPIRRAA